jgi:hypothetical protein
MTGNVIVADGDPLTLAEAAAGRVLDRVLADGEPATVVDSPPGAGKTTLVQTLSATAIQHDQLGLRVAVITPKAEQSFDFVRRTFRDFRPMAIQLLQSRERPVPEDLAPMVPTWSRPGDLARGPGLTVGVAAKFFDAAPSFGANAFDLIICDESYQLGLREFGPIAKLAPQIVLVGDPGQLPPQIRADTGRAEGAPVKVHWAVPREVLRQRPDLPLIQLPVTRRLPQDTVDLVQSAFYPTLPFRSAVGREDRRLAFGLLGFGNPVDRALDLLAGGATVVALLLPPRPAAPDNVDEEVSAMAASVAARLLDRQVTVVGRQVAASDIGYADVHVTSGEATARAMRRQGLPPNSVLSLTPEVWQGSERDIMIVKHPLSGRTRLSGFDLEPGRWCVMLSRHRAACIIVAREGIINALNDHRHDCGERAMTARDALWDGRSAHLTFWQALESAGRVVRW